MADDSTAGVSRMEWREKLICIGLGLVLISLGLVIFDVWSLLVVHLTRSNCLDTQNPRTVDECT